MMLAATTVAMLLISSPSQSDADRIAAEGGFLLGTAHRCGVATERVVRGTRLVRGLIDTAAEDGDAKDSAIKRFTEFFLASAVPDRKTEKFAVSCDATAGELTLLEHHRTGSAGAAKVE